MSIGPSGTSGSKPYEEGAFGPESSGHINNPGQPTIDRSPNPLDIDRRILELLRTLEGRIKNLPIPEVVNYASSEPKERSHKVDYEGILKRLKSIDDDLSDIPTLFRDQFGNIWDSYRAYLKWRYASSE